MRRIDTLTVEQARRIALAAQGLGRARPAARVDARHLRRVIRDVGLLQIDSVNVLLPAHYQVPFSRLGAYDRALLDDLVYRRRELTEQWAHEASIIPMAHWPLLRHRMVATERRLRALGEFMREHAPYVASVLAQVRDRGPLTAADVPEPDGARGTGSGWWGWTRAKAALEGHFAFGALAISARRSAGFARVYDLAERVIPAPHRERDVNVEEARRALLMQSARALGVATARDIADYYRLPVSVARAGIDALAAEGALRAVRVDGWKEPAYLHPDAQVPRRVGACALLSPFDPVVWFRPRTERLFDFTYRIEIYVPQAKRRWGYYVLPFLLGDRLVARVDLKADRAGGRLMVQAAHREPHARADEVAPALAAELHVMAGWLGLGEVTVARRGDLSAALARESGR